MQKYTGSMRNSSQNLEHVNSPVMVNACFLLWPYVYYILSFLSGNSMSARPFSFSSLFVMFCKPDAFSCHCANYPFPCHLWLYIIQL